MRFWRELGHLVRDAVGIAGHAGRAAAITLTAGALAPVMGAATLAAGATPAVATIAAPAMASGTVAALTGGDAGRAALLAGGDAAISSAANAAAAATTARTAATALSSGATASVMAAATARTAVHAAGATALAAAAGADARHAIAAGAAAVVGDVVDAHIPLPPAASGALHAALSVTAAGGHGMAILEAAATGALVGAFAGAQHPNIPRFARSLLTAGLWVCVERFRLLYRLADERHAEPYASVIGETRRGGCDGHGWRCSECLWHAAFGNGGPIDPPDRYVRWADLHFGGDDAPECPDECKVVSSSSASLSSSSTCADDTVPRRGPLLSSNPVSDLLSSYSDATRAAMGGFVPSLPSAPASSSALAGAANLAAAAAPFAGPLGTALGTAEVALRALDGNVRGAQEAAEGMIRDSAIVTILTVGGRIPVASAVGLLIQCDPLY